jgi:Uma2 family endonuclease
MDIVLGRDLDLGDLYATPDDGNKYEILDGALVMTPPPSTLHQNASAELHVALHAAARTAGLKVLAAPVAWRIGPGQVPEPDLVVAAPEHITQRAVEGPPALVVEIVSPSGRGRDLFEKRRIYAAGRAAWYWILDPDEPTLTVLRLVGDAYEETSRVVGSEAYEAEEPLRLRVVPAALVR